MRVLINLDGKQNVYSASIQHYTVLRLKKVIEQGSGIPVKDQSLFDYPEKPLPTSGLRAFKNGNILMRTYLTNNLN